MKLINGAIVLAAAMVLISCGGANKEKVQDTTTEKSTDSTKVAAGTYTNDQLGYTISYPKDILIAQDDSANGDEKVFKSAQGKAELRIALDKRVDKAGKPISFDVAYEQDIADKKGRQIAYSSLKPNFYTISGLDNGLLYYQKTIFTKGALVTATLKYPKEEKDTFNGMLPSLFGSFK